MEYISLLRRSLGILLLVLVPGRATVHAAVPDSVRNGALNQLERLLTGPSAEARVRAAGYLLDLQYTERVMPALKTEIATEDPFLRIAFWKLMASVSSSPDERSEWIQRMEAVSRDVSAADREEAITALAAPGLVPAPAPVALPEELTAGVRPSAGYGPVNAELAERGTEKQIPFLYAQIIDSPGFRANPEEQASAAYAILRIDRRQEHTLSFPDWAIIVIYGGLMLGIGWFYSRKNKSREDYLLGGRKMNPVTVGISLFATLLSTLSYLSYPGEMIQHGPVIFAGMFSLPFVYYAVGWWLIPYIMKTNVISAYEILEKKLGISVRMFATFMFLALRFLWMATIVYVTVDIALFSVVPFDRAYMAPIGILLMVITIIYTAMGGLKAVVVTDVIQSVIFLGGAFLSVLVVCYHFGSFTSWLPHEWPVHWKPPIWGFNATERSTVGNAMLMLFLWYICTTGSDQMAIQRYLATKDIRTARKSLRVSLYTNLLAKCLLGLVGLAVLAFFSRNPHLLPDKSTIKGQADTLFPRFILVGLPVGLSGLVIAGLLAAAMSSLSSGLNSVSSVLSEDLIQRFRKTKTSGEGLLKQVQRLSYLSGLLVIVMSLYVGNVEGNLLDIVNKVVNLLVGPLFVLFFMALFVPFATPAGTIAGGVISILTACAIAFYGVLNITVFWILPLSLLAGVTAGVIFSFAERKLLRN